MRVGIAQLRETVRCQGPVPVLRESHYIGDDLGMNEADEVLAQDRRRLLALDAAIMDVPPQKTSAVGTGQRLEGRGIGPWPVPLKPQLCSKSRTTRSRGTRNHKEGYQRIDRSHN